MAHRKHRFSMHFRYHHEICFKMMYNINIFAKLQKSSNFGWSRMTPLWIYPNISKC